MALGKLLASASMRRNLTQGAEVLEDLLSNRSSTISNNFTSKSTKDATSIKIKIRTIQTRLRITLTSRLAKRSHKIIKKNKRKNRKLRNQSMTKMQAFLTPSPIQIFRNRTPKQKEGDSEMRTGRETRRHLDFSPLTTMSRTMGVEALEEVVEEAEEGVVTTTRIEVDTKGEDTKIAAPIKKEEEDLNQVGAANGTKITIRLPTTIPMKKETRKTTTILITEAEGEAEEEEGALTGKKLMKMVSRKKHITSKGTRSTRSTNRTTNSSMRHQEAAVTLNNSSSTSRSRKQNDHRSLFPTQSYEIRRESYISPIAWAEKFSLA